MRWMVMVSLALAGCSGGTDNMQDKAATAPRPTATPTTARKDVDRYLGHYVGVEGMFLDVAPGKDPHSYRLTMQWDLDHRGTFEARQMPMELGLDFHRDGKLERLQPSDGDATGLKYLAGKKDCLTVKPGEGYCRD